MLAENCSYVHIMCRAKHFSCMLQVSNWPLCCGEMFHLDYFWLRAGRHI